MVTDHKLVTYLQSQPSLSRRQTKWNEFLQMFKYRWQHRPGRINVADPLSRVHCIRLAALTGRQALFEPAVESAAEPAAIPEPVLQNLSPVMPDAAAELSLTAFQQQLLQGYEHDSACFDKLTPAEQGKCHQQQGFWYHNHSLVVPDF